MIFHMLLGAGAVLLFLPPMRLIHRWLVRHVKPSPEHQIEVISDLMAPFLDDSPVAVPERVTSAIVILADCSQDPAPVYAHVIGADTPLAVAMLGTATLVVRRVSGSSFDGPKAA